MALQAQVRLEEADLDRSQGKGYLAYKAGTPRWLAWRRPAPRTRGGQPTG